MPKPKLTTREKVTVAATESTKIIHAALQQALTAKTKEHSEVVAMISLVATTQVVILEALRDLLDR
jgi:hypothetical protein